MAKPYLSSHPPPQVRKRLGVSGVRIAPFVPNDSSLAGVGVVRFCRLFRGAKLAPSIGRRTISAVIGPQGMTSSLLMMSLILALPKIGCGLAILSLTLVEVTSR